VTGRSRVSCDCTQEVTKGRGSHSAAEPVAKHLVVVRLGLVWSQGIKLTDGVGAS